MFCTISFVSCQMCDMLFKDVLYIHLCAIKCDVFIISVQFYGLKFPERFSKIIGQICELISNN